MLTSDQFRSVLYSVEDGVASITLNRPEQRNAFTPDMYNELRWAVRAAEVDDSVDIMVISGAGNVFSSGGDLKESYARISTGGALAMHDFFDSVPFYDIRDSRKVVIAAINGACYAGGLVTAMWCDLAVAVESAKFALTEAKVGTADAFTPAVLFGRMPTLKLKQMVFTAKPITAVDAERIGLISEVVPDGTLASRIKELVAEIRQTDPAGRALYKKFINELIPRPLNHGAVETFPKMAAAIQGSKFAAKSK